MKTKASITEQRAQMLIERAERGLQAWHTTARDLIDAAKDALTSDAIYALHCAKVACEEVGA
jgi:hypothetical protein